MASTLISGGVVIDTSPEPTVIGTADVLVKDGRIAAVGKGLVVEEGTEVIDATGRLVLPGFVDTHRHTWQAGLHGALIDDTLPGYLERVVGGFARRFRPEDVYAGTLAGALECLDSGITTLVDWSHIQHTPDHTDANLEALRASGIRAVFGYAYGGDGGNDGRRAEATRVRGAVNGLVSMAMAAFGPEFGDLEGSLNEWQVARELDVPVTAHMGGHGAENAERGLAFLEQHGVADHPTTYVHANYYTDEHFKRIADHGGTVSVSPVTETELVIGYPITGRARAAGIPASLSGDSVITGGADMFAMMRAAYMLERVRPDGAGLGFTTRDVLRMATIEGAQVAGLGDVVGSLTPGKQADLVLLRTDSLNVAPAHDAIAAATLFADTSAVDTVMVAGRVVKRDGRLVDHDLQTVLENLTTSAAHITAA
ncbi:amidohydrolase family protein [Actinomadura barringtoniae]|uniref:Amidohydrolase family protein n=1 Tax=Actinomadura barringtoniae TaxID=1427535 RepID=A0A939PC02_9ACTN|nr:amidohydrolase family protein [Actinomadura barringtoniae]MBO2446849.1 amidohydrolase family protein [Actinomadura barringtoniae]